MRFLIGLAILALASNSYARGPLNSLSSPVFKDEGDRFGTYKTVVGSNAAVIQPFSPDKLQDRSIIIQNPSLSYDLLIASWAGFTMSDSWILVPHASGTLECAMHSEFYMLYPPGASSETVRMGIFKQ